MDDSNSRLKPDGARAKKPVCEKEPALRVRVECYAGYRADQDVRRFFIGSRAISVVKTLDRWVGTDHRYFKVKGDDDGVYILRQNTVHDVWELTLYRQGKEE